MNLHSSPQQVQDIKRRPPEEVRWLVRKSRQSQRLRVYIWLALSAAVILLVSILVGYWLGR